jgi:hypothetical protein
MAAGNRHLRYKDALNASRPASPGTKHAFYFEFLAKAAGHFQPEAATAAGRPAPQHLVRGATTWRGVRLAAASSRTAWRRRPGPRRAGPQWEAGDEPAFVRNRVRRCC